MENGAWTKSSQVSICNKALGFMGVGRTINSLTEATAEAGVMKRYYDAALTSLFQRNDWNFCRGMTDLADIVGSVPGAAYAYQYPNNCAKVLRLFHSAEDCRHRWSGDFRIGMSAGTRVICSNFPATTAQYTVLVADPTLFPPLFEEALCWNLARMACWSLSDVSMNMRDEITKQFLAAYGDACAADANEGRLKLRMPDCDYVRIR